jgi:ABC-2 type transport system permease protein
MDSRIFHFIVKEFRQLLRDQRMLRTAMIMPVIQLLMFGYIASTDLKNVPMAIMDEDRTSFSRAYIKSIENTGSFDLKYYVQDEKQFSELLDSGKAAVAVHIPRDFKKDLLSGGSANVQAVIDGSNSSNATIILGYINQINFTNSNAILQDRLNKAGAGAGDHSPFSLETRLWYNPDLKSLYFMVPAIFAQILMMISMILTMFSVVKEKEKGTIEQLMVTPLMPYELILGKLIPPVCVAFADSIFAFLVAVLWFRVPIHGSALLLFVLGIIFSVTGLGIGLFVSTISRTQRQAILTNNLIMSPQFILSGFIFPIASMPVLIQLFTHLIPLRYFLIIVRGIFIKGIGIKYLWSEVWPMVIFSLAILALSVSRFRKKLE